MKVVVIYPEVLDMARYRKNRKEFPPFGALYIASSIEEKGHEVKILKLDPHNLTFDFSKYDAVAFSISASATFNMFMECRFNSTFRDDALIMAGGIHANLFPEQTLLDLKPHVVGIGEGEDTIIELLEQKDNKKFYNINGVCFLVGEKPFRTSPRVLSKNINNFSFPARHLLPQSDFIMEDRMSNTNIKMTHIMPGRGCPFPCRFCASAQTRVQYRSGADIKNELHHLIDNYGIEGFAIVGNDFIINKDNVKDICESIKELDLSWATLSRVDRVDSKTLKIMKNAGCYELEFGVETGSQKILDKMNKRIKIQQIKDGLKLSYEAGIKNKVFLIHGYPGESYETTMETIELLEEVGQWIERTSLFRFVPLPGTYVYNNPGEYNIRGTINNSNWDGNWGKFHIHHNHHHWWGTKKDYQMLNITFEILYSYVESRWPSKFKLANLPKDEWQEQSKIFSTQFKKN